ncbi:hypothetical protein ACCO45_012986 [Purpureocillium lilacinum]|uniref:Uncharacterized protein n=1 Tax=Purpureocillium lilacinum TaxID=33203 RepID=A0ACC4DAJ2_PURLI
MATAGHGSDGLQVNMDYGNQPEAYYPPGNHHDVSSQKVPVVNDSDSTHSDPSPSGSPAATSASTSTSASASASASPSASPGATGHFSDCPGSNGTTYTSTAFSSGRNGDVPDGARNGLRFIKLCGTGIQGNTNIAQGRVSSLDECIDLCASYNFWSGSKNCTSATYDENSSCWIGSGRWFGPTAHNNLDAAVLADTV